MKRFGLLSLLGIIIISALLISPLILESSAKQYGNIDINIYDQNNNPLGDVDVYCLQNSVFIIGGRTTSKGFVRLMGLPRGKYDLICRRPLKPDHTVKDVLVEAGKTTKLDIVMETPQTEVPRKPSQREVMQEDMPYASERISYYSGRANYSMSSARDYQIIHDTDEFSPIHPNVFLRTDINPLSTFSIDVDTGSYSILRSWMQNNKLPPLNAIRTEELLNYFSYDYPLPHDDHPFAIYTEVGKCPWNEERQLVHIGLQGKKMNLEEAPPSNLVFLVDVSGSMNAPNRLPLVIRSLNLLVDELREQDRIAIVVYASRTGVVLESTPGNEKEKIKAVLNSLTAGGSTAGSAAIQQAYQTAEENFIEGGNNRIILCTDGDFNVGVSSTAHLVEMVQEKSKSGIYLTALGFGMGNYKDNRLEQIASAGNGSYGYIDNIVEARKIFVHDLISTLFTIAHDVKIQVEFNPVYVRAYRLIGYENRLLRAEDFLDDTKDAGELGAGHTVTALYEIIPVGSDETIPLIDDLKYQRQQLNLETDNSREMLTVKLRYKLPGEDESIPLDQVLLYNDTPWEQCSNDFRFSTAVASFSMLLTDSEFKGNLTWDKVKQMAANSLGEDEYGYRAGFMNLVEIAELLKIK